jgi:hypothetical protein
MSPYNRAGEHFERLCRVSVPVKCEEVVVEDIDEDAGYVVEVAADPRSAAVDDRVRVGEHVDHLVLPDTVQERGRHGGAVAALDEVRQQVAEAELDGGLGQEDVGQPVHVASSLRTVKLTGAGAQGSLSS